MNVSRRLPDGSYDDREVLNKSQIYVTTAGWKNSFAYEKLITLLIQQIIEPEEAIVLGGSWRIPVMEGLLSKTFIKDLKMDGTYNDASFAREYESEWSGDAENAFFSAEKFDKYRVLLQPEYEYSARNNKNGYYIIGVDVGRYKCTTEATIIKVNPQLQGAGLKSLVNIYTYDAEDFEEQAINLKKLYYKYKARQLVIDANGLGAGLIDFMTKTQVDPDTGEDLIPFGVSGGTTQDAIEPYKKIRGTGVEENAMFLMRANANINTEAHTYVQTQMYSGKIRFLVDENQAKVKLMSLKRGQQMNADERADYLRPFVVTTILREQTLNLIQDNEGINIILKQSSRSIKKDKFSAFEYALYYIKQEEDLKKKRRKRNIKDFMFFS